MNSPNHHALAVVAMIERIDSTTLKRHGVQIFLQTACLN
jgi:hypothetical protein